MKEHGAPRPAVDEWALSLPEEDGKRLMSILVYTPFARHFLELAWRAGYERAYTDRKYQKQ